MRRMAGRSVSVESRISGIQRYHRLHQRFEHLRYCCVLPDSTEWHWLAEEECGIMHFFEEGGMELYEFVLHFAKENGIRVVYDIGCATGYQNEVFIGSGIHYIGIDDTLPAEHYWNSGKYGLLRGRYPFAIKAAEKAMAVSVLCVGWGVYKLREDTWSERFKQMARDFDVALVYMSSDALPDARKYWKRVESVSCNADDSLGRFYCLRKE